MKKVLKIIVIMMFVIIISILIVFIIGILKQNVPAHYESKVETGGTIEEKYLQHGQYDVGYREESVLQNYKKYEIYYPLSLENDDYMYPLLIVNNGTGVKASKAKAMFKHFASWGFIVIGNEEEYSWNGFSADMSLNYMIKQNNNTESLFYQKIDLKNIGVIGHSQGGVGAINAATNTKHQSMYKTIVVESPAHQELAKALEWHYSVENINIPFFMIAGTRESDSQLVSPLTGMNQIYDAIISSPIKVMARRKNMEHGEMLYSADGYVTAWLMWQLQNDQDASYAFVGNHPEISRNELYQDQRIDESE